MISIIIPACNEEKYISKTLDSIRSQSFKNYEIIVVCDGCTDKTAKKAKSADKVVILKRREGPGVAKNKGAEKAKGDVLVFLDADTEITEGLLHDIFKNKNKYLIGTAKIKPSNNKFKHKLFMALKNHFVCPFGVTNGIVFCKKDTFFENKGFPHIKKREEGIFVRDLKKRGKFYISRYYVINSTRRFDKKGYVKVIGYWIKEALKPSNEDYEVIR